MYIKLIPDYGNIFCIHEDELNKIWKKSRWSDMAITQCKLETDECVCVCVCMDICIMCVSVCVNNNTIKSSSTTCKVSLNRVSNGHWCYLSVLALHLYFIKIAWKWNYKIPENWIRCHQTDLCVGLAVRFRGMWIVIKLKNAHNS